MKKILHLLISVTITFGTIPNLLANNIYPLSDNAKKANLRNDFYVLIDGIIEIKSTDYKEWISAEPLNAIKDLGTINENKPEAILLAIKEKYPKVKMEEVELEIPKDNYNALDNIFWAYLKIKETSISYPQMLLNKKVIFKIKGHNIKKRNTPKSLAELTSTVNIGDIELFDIDEEHIRNRLAALNHSIFSQPAFLENLIFDSITETRATGHLQQSIMIGTNRIISRINTFTINYNPIITLSRVVPNQNLEHLNDNYKKTILEQFKNLNPLIAGDTMRIEVLKIKQTSAIISLFGVILYKGKAINFYDNKPFEVNFNADKFTLSSLTTTTDLGELPNNNATTIKRAFLNHNLHIRESDISSIEVLSVNNAIIYGNLGRDDSILVFLQCQKRNPFLMQ